MNYMVFVPYTDLDILLQQWTQAGILSVLVVFALVFAVVFAILNKSKILGGKAGIDAVVAIALALGALQFDWVTRNFYSNFFNNIGVGIVILLGLLVLVGLFGGTDETGKFTKTWGILFAVAGFIIFLAILIKSYGSSVWQATSFWSMYGGYIVLGIIVVGIILLVTLTSRGPPATRG